MNNSGGVTPSSYLAHLSSPTSDCWPHYVTTPTPSYRDDSASGNNGGGNGSSDDYHFFGHHGGLDLAAATSSSSTMRHSDDDADIGDEIHLANMAFMNASSSSSNKGAVHHHHHHQETPRQSKSYPDDYVDDGQHDSLDINDT